MSQVTIDMTEQQHRSLQAMAASQGKTIGQYAIERLFPGVDAGEDQAWSEFEAFLKQRVADGLAGEVSTRSFRDIVDDELGADRQA